MPAPEPSVELSHIRLTADREEGCQPGRLQPKNKMASKKRKAASKTAIKLKDLKARKNPTGGVSSISWSGSTGGDDQKISSRTHKPF